MSEGNERNQGTQAQGGQTDGQNVQDQGAQAQGDQGKGRLSLRPGGRMELGRTVDAGSVRQSFSHGRSKVVQVEVRKKRENNERKDGRGSAGGRGGRAGAGRALTPA
ncbi:translation initiation factor IF-2 associated domain-containing protein, partial [Asaia astilbis]|uniref:translation initiation factor IF-2 associated domain-containing protein n=1 Tax=Asaia astilbis TaxID=610244 RepID=UPI00046F858C